jgi:acid phosphatase (class A)
MMRKTLLGLGLWFLVAAPPAFSLSDKPYLGAGQPDLIDLLPPAPQPGSVEQERDLTAVLNVQKARTEAQATRATADATISIFRFADVMGADFAEAKVPKTVKDFFDKVRRETNGPVNLVKDCWERPRPFVASSAVHPVANMAETTRSGPNATNTAPHGEGSPCRRGEPAPAYSYSYPSGHSTFGAITAILLAQMVPEKRDALYARGWEFGRNRVVLGVHFPSDVEAGRIDATLMVGAMMENPDFRADMAAAKADLRRTLGFSQ